MCCTRLAVNRGCKNYAKNRHLRTIAQLLSGCIFATKACIDNQKKLVEQQYLLHMSSQYGELRHAIPSEICWGVWGTPANFNRFRILASLLHRRRSTEVNHALHDVWPFPGLVHCTFWGGSCPLTEFWQLQNSLPQVLRSPILAAILHGTRAVSVSQSLWHGTRSGITELSQRAPPIFGRAAITLGIGPHSSFLMLCAIEGCVRRGGGPTHVPQKVAPSRGALTNGFAV